jgi:molecular chaperone GrpE
MDYQANPLAQVSEAAAEHVLHDAEAEGRDDVTALTAALQAAQAETAAQYDKWLRLNAEFDNFRKRNAKERLELVQFAAENVLRSLLPAVDDIERAIANNVSANDANAIKEGMALIQSKLLHLLAAQGLKPMADVKGSLFDVDRHEAITKAPAPEPGLKGKVIDVIESGYLLHDKVVRYAKVVVGE